MSSIDPSLLPRRDARGHFLEAPPWLQPGWRRINALGLGLGGQARLRCAYGGCRDVPVRGSDRCWHHDQNWRKRRLTELRTGKGKPMTRAECAKLFRLDTQNMWNRAGPWLPMLTIWFAPRIETAFAADCHNAGLPLSKLAPAIANNLRWSWARSVLNHRDDPGWQRSLAAARRRQLKLAPPEGNDYQPPSATPPHDPRVRVITRRAVAWEPASANPVIDRSTKAKLRRQRRAPLKPPAGFRWRQFLATHWRAIFAPLFGRYRIDPDEADGAAAEQLVIAYRALLDERKHRAVGPAQRCWSELLQSLNQGGRPVSQAASPSPRRLSSQAIVGRPGNDAWLEALLAKVDDARRS